MASHQSQHWSTQGQHPEHPDSHHVHPTHSTYYRHPPPPHHPPPSHPQHSYYQYPYYPPYPSYPPHPHPYPPHGYPPQPAAGDNSVPSSKTPSATSSKPTTSNPADVSKATAKNTKTTKDSDTTKSSNVPKPKTFRFEGSISSESFKSTKTFDLAGVNILNRKPLDTKTALDKLQRRRETHNRVERKRRDCINQLIDDLTKLLPPQHLEEATSKCHRVNVLRGAVSHIRFLSESNDALMNSIRAIKGDDASLPAPTQEINVRPDAGEKKNSDRDISMDLDDEIIKEEDMDDDDQFGDSISRSGSPASVSTKRSTSPKKMLPPPVIVTDAPNPSTGHDGTDKSTDQANAFSLESRPRSNSFASSVGDQPSPRTYTSSPTFPPSPTSPLPFGRHLFPSGEDNPEGSSRQDRDQRLSPFMSPSPVPSPSLPPISSLANMHLHSPSGHLSASASEGHSHPNLGSSPNSNRSHRAGTSLPPLMIPEPHHLHPSYQQGGPSSSSSSKRSSVTLSPNTADQSLMSPFMLSPMLPRSPSIGPATASSPGNSPYPHWGQDGVTSPHAFPFGNQHPYPYGYQYPPQDNHQQGPTSPPPKSNDRPKSLQPEPIFIQEEPWNVQRKRSASSASNKGSSKASSQEKKKAEYSTEMSDPTSPTPSVTSTTSYPASPNPKKRTQLESYNEGENEEDMAKRHRQTEDGHEDAPSQRNSGVVVVVDGPESDKKDRDAI
ncbi:hypothetical protein BGZ80_001496 [Entomortierella chlamydospora]|uniref:BHLH domain-containing protein n=1 Tax=Entomortierella chlamydospora TaxID=101097 RepID=A0A9P6SYA5_9FUNG|nr:hypothetical protein BGZ79_010043 [Entomortierella chlamydospora]KAG0010427.1 hypothetical protein BGZ80_001496 [Entomortierella chlamydospora]